LSLQLAPSLYHVKTSLFELIQAGNEVSTFETVGECSRARMTKEDSQTEAQRILLDMGSFHIWLARHQATHQGLTMP
jgi:hypothetical protein